MVNAASYGPNPRFAPEKMGRRERCGTRPGWVPPPPSVYKNNGVAQTTACRSLSYKGL